MLLFNLHCMSYCTLLYSDLGGITLRSDQSIIWSYCLIIHTEVSTAQINIGMSLLNGPLYDHDLLNTVLCRIVTVCLSLSYILVKECLYLGNLKIADLQAHKAVVKISMKCR